MAYLDDQNGRPVQQRFLDLVSLKPQEKEEVLSAMHKLAEMKLRPEKIPDEENVVKPLSWKNIKEFPYLDPVPSCMLHADINELSSVDIDWKMLTMDRPESQLDTSIFSRMVYLHKLMMKCILAERQKKEKERQVRLRTKGKIKPLADSDVDRSDEFTYDYFSRFFGSIDRAGPMEDMPKPAADQDAKRAKSPVPADNQPANKTSTALPSRRGKRLNASKKLRKKKRRKKKSKKSKLRKRKGAAASKLSNTKKPANADQRLKKFKQSLLLSKRKKTKSVITPKKKGTNVGVRSGAKKKTESNKTLIQMLKVSEQQDKKKKDKNSKS